MINVTFDGVEFTKATQVAKEFGYTSDYLGQLCRAKKVNARLIGRSWFINVPSLEKHREKKYQGSAVKKMQIKESSPEVEDVQIQIEKEKPDTPSKKYLRRVPSPKSSQRLTTVTTDSGSIHYPSLRYEADANSLIPKVASSPKVTLLKVSIADSSPLKVKSTQTKISKLKPAPLPDVALSGLLSVAEIPDGEYTNEESEKDKETDSEKSPTRDKSINKVKILTEPDAVEEVETLDDKTEQKNTVEPKALHKRVRMNSIKVNTVSDIQENTLKSDVSNIMHEMHEEIPVIQASDSFQIIPIQIRMPVAGVLLGIVVGSLLLSAEQVVLVTENSATFNIEFAWSKVTNMALVLFTG